MNDDEIDNLSRSDQAYTEKIIKIIEKQKEAN